MRLRSGVKIPVIGIGGISSGEDAAEFLIAGATAVEVGTATSGIPSSPLRVAHELREFLRQERDRERAGVDRNALF